MSDEINPKPELKDNTGIIVLWLLFAFVPCFVAIPLMNNPSPTVSGGLLILTVTCSLCSGIGVLRGVKNQAARILLGLVLAGVFFVLNVIVVVFIGCSNMGRVAP
jgi:hypothetical protein